MLPQPERKRFTYARVCTACANTPKSLDVYRYRRGILMDRRVERKKIMESRGFFTSMLTLFKRSMGRVDLPVSGHVRPENHHAKSQ